MSFLSVLFALLLEQAWPLKRANPVHAAMRAWVRWSARSLDAGERMHGWLVWSVAVGGPALVSVAIYWMLALWVAWPLALLWSALVLYASLGFRQFSFHFTQIRDALTAQDDAQARQLLADWQQCDTADLTRDEVIGRVIEVSVLAAHRHVFGVLAWFSVLAALGLGPTGAVLYRMGELAPRYWLHVSQSNQQPVSIALQGVAARMWSLLDWLPARMTAMTFAVVGNFEEAIDGWRRYGWQPQPESDGIVLAATAGAVNLQLPYRGASMTTGAPSPTGSPEEPQRPIPQIPHLAAVVGLVWRAVVMWVMLLALLTLSRLLA